ncbi:MAG: hypothetical protein KJ607_13860, partial [Bacteroidetes bacterium]|nr:hypothetical protein [Bacteroidota bacterium]
MKHFTAFFCFILSFSLMAQTGTEGYYKDIFMDGGVSLTSRTSLAAADSLSLSLEYLATDDQDIQNDKIIGDVWDYNGALLYPDGEPRFRHIQTNGGAATSHGSSLTQAGRERIRAFYYNGGCYTGCCAGAFIVSLNAQETDTNNSYYHIWPGRTQSTGLLDTYTGHFIEPGCPLLQFNDFGGDDYIDNLYHNGGCFAREFTDFPPETEVLLRFDYSGYTMHQKPSSWAYKKNAASGRLVVIGSHPEGVTSGERLELMKAMILYAIDGQGELSVKDTLQNGQTRNMDKSTEDNDPAYAKIGDRQYHHFAVDLPEGAAQFIVTLTGEPDYHLNLFVRQGEYAFQSNAAYSDTMSGSNKILTVGPVPPGTYYISVECATTVVTAEQSWGYEYTDNMEVLDGVSYSIRSDWSLTDAPITNFYAADTSDCNG